MRLCIYCKKEFEDCLCDDKDYANMHDYSINELIRLSHEVKEMENNYLARLKEYNKECAELAKQRQNFYDNNPDFPIKSMFIQVIPPPAKFSITIDGHK